jgi:hypothetical protein
MHLFEWIVGIAILGLLSVVFYSSQVETDFAKCESASVMMQSFLKRERQWAMIQHSDAIIISLDERHIGQENRLAHQFELPIGVRIKTFHKVGFTAKGRSKYANTIELQCGSVVRRITVGVGYGRVRLP